MVVVVLPLMLTKAESSLGRLVISERRAGLGSQVLGIFG